jgi:DNA-binding GntR family transcriptional regulator
MSLREKIYQKVLDDITKGRLSPGERLLESKLMDEFKCSQSPVREAFRQLESEGLLTYEENKGSTIRKLSTQEIYEIYCVLSVLTSYSAFMSTEQVTKKDVVHLRNLHNKLKEAAKKQDLVGWLQANNEFHDFFPNHSGNKTLLQILENLKLRIYTYRHITMSIPHRLEEYIKHHEAILEGLQGKDGEKVAAYMKLHIETVRDGLISYLSQFPGSK